MTSLRKPHSILRFDQSGHWLGLEDPLTGKNLIQQQCDWWRVILDDGERHERTIGSLEQSGQVTLTEDSVEIRYTRLVEGTVELPIEAIFTFVIVEDEIRATAELIHHGKSDDFTIVEAQFPLIPGVKNLGGDPAKEYIVWPHGAGSSQIFDPLNANLNRHRFSEMYREPHEKRTAIHLLYPGANVNGAIMSWFGWFRNDFGVYLGSHDPEPNKVLLYIERHRRTPSISMGFIRYPFLKSGHRWKSAESVIAFERGDWHAGSCRYRRWVESTWWKKPEPPEWVKRLNGWIRIIQLHEYGEVLFPFSEVPKVAADALEFGLSNISLIGWNRGGFSRNWPDYDPAEVLGGKDEMTKAIDDLHAAGSTVAAFVSYSTVDPCTDWYRQIGHKLTNRNYYGLEKTFPEVYSGMGTWRQAINGVKHNRVICSHSREWNDLMRSVAVRLVRQGVDAVMFDAPSFNLFCFADGHGHDGRPADATKNIGSNLADFRAAVREIRNDAAVFMENTIDRYNTSVDLAQSVPVINKQAMFWELYRYTFPEFIVTNREWGFDDDNCFEHVAWSLIYGFRFDMSVYRCRGTIQDVPAYAPLLKNACGLREQLADILLTGHFRDEDGLKGNDGLRAKVFEAETRFGVVVWNPTGEARPLELRLNGFYPAGWYSLEDGGKSSPPPKTVSPGNVGIAVFAKPLPS